MRLEAANEDFAFVSVVTILIGNTARSHPASAQRGEFVNIQQRDDTTMRSFVAGPEDSSAVVLIVHDYFGISDGTRESMERLGYRAMAINLYGGRSASTHEEAVKLMQGLERKETDKVLQTGLDQLEKPGRKIATLGFSMGGQKALFANLMATVIVYGFGFDKLETVGFRDCPVLVLSGAEDTGAVQTASGFLANMKSAARQCEMFIYPGADHS